MKRMLRFLVAGLTVSLALSPAVFAADEAYPSRPITMVVGLGIGGSSDRLARAMSVPVGAELGQPVVVINKPGAQTLLGSDYVLRQPNDGYTVYAGAISPYLPLNILSGKAKMEDWSIINIQWPDYCLIAANNKTPYKTLPELLQAIKANPGKLSCAVMQGSVGQMTISLLLNEMGLKKGDLRIVTYSSGGSARSAVAGGQVDFVAIAAEGCEPIREFLTPLAVVLKQNTSKLWDAPPINEALAPMNITVPIIMDAARGFMVPKALEIEQPERYKKLVAALQAATTKAEVRDSLTKGQIGSEWSGPEESTRMVQEVLDMFTKFKDDLDLAKQK